MEWIGNSIEEHIENPEQREKWYKNKKCVIKRHRGLFKATQQTFHRDFYVKIEVIVEK